MPSDVTRRSFVAGSAAALASLWMSRRARGSAGAPGELIVGAVKYSVQGGALAYAMVAIDTAGQRYAHVMLDFHFHGFAPHPIAHERAVLFEKKGPGACVVDLRAKKVLRPLRTADDRHFYGHGAWSPDGKRLYATESMVATGEGVIIVRDGATLNQVGEFPTHGRRPHDCVLVDRGRTLVITNGGGTLAEPDAPACVTFVDVSSKKLIEKLTFDNPRVNAGHLALTGRRELVVISAPRTGLPESELGAISVRAPQHKLHALTDPPELTRRMVGETLSLAIHEPSSVVGVTTPDANLVSFWNYKRGKLIKSLPLEHPRAIALTLDQKSFAVSHGKRPILSYFSTASYAPQREVPDAYLSGSHMYTWLV